MDWRAMSITIQQWKFYCALVLLDIVYPTIIVVIVWQVCEEFACLNFEWNGLHTIFTRLYIYSVQCTRPPKNPRETKWKKAKDDRIVSGIGSFFQSKASKVSKLSKSSYVIHRGRKNLERGFHLNQRFILPSSIIYAIMFCVLIILYF